MNFLILLVVSIVSATAGYVGTMMLSKRMSLAAGPLGHLALPGVALALLYNFNVFLGALGFILFGALIVWFLRRISNLSFEALTGIAFAFGLSLGFLLLPMEHAEEAIMGDVTTITLEDLWIVLVLSAIIFALTTLIRKDIVLVTLSEDLAKTLHVNVKLCDLIYLLSIALVAAMEVKIVGGILTVALVILPAATTSLFAKSLKQYLILSPLIGIFSSIIGLYLYEITSLPAGPLIVLTAFSLFLIAAIIRRIAS